MDILVVTGGIGSGKSEVCRILQALYGCGVYNADERVKRLYDVHPTLLSDIERLVEEPLRNEDGCFLPSRLSARIFSDRSLLKRVEELVFPALTDDFRTWADTYASDRFVVFESATILEKPQLKGFGDKVILVDSGIETRLERACLRDNATRESVYARMQNQKMMNSISEGKTEPEADAVIHNSGTLDDLKNNVMKVINELY
ncbi:MAG: dephospho-CoA kinase [Bacteroidales bacterium]|nr:dephospho-CoA kinase [Bacteroidales bacterium]